MHGTAVECGLDVVRVNTYHELLSRGMPVDPAADWLYYCYYYLLLTTYLEVVVGTLLRWLLRRFVLGLRLRWNQVVTRL